MKNEITRKDDSTIAIKVTIPWSDVEKTKEKTIDEMVKNLEAPGFRKGAVPRKIALERLSKEAVDEQTLKAILPDAYINAVKENKINPLINPKIHVEAFEESKDLIFTAETCEEPQIELKDYKDAVKDVTAKSKIVIPGKEEQKPSMEEIVDALIKNTDVKLSHLLVEHEADRLLSQLLEEIKTLGLSLEQYLGSTGKTPEQLRKDYEVKAEKDLKLEFLLRKIADAENITVEQKDIDEVLSKIKDEKQKGEMAKNIYLLSALIRQQKVLDFLSKI